MYLLRVAVQGFIHRMNIVLGIQADPEVVREMTEGQTPSRTFYSAACPEGIDIGHLGGSLEAK